MGTIIFSGLLWILYVIGIVGVVGIVFLIPAVIIFAVLISKEKDELKKKAKIKKGIIYLSSPFALVAGSLIAIVILKAVQGLLAG